MGKIRKILETELVGGTQSTDVYPVTSTKAVYDTNNKVLDDYIQHLKKTSTFAGIATPTTNPGTPDGPVFYIAGEGTYANFSNIVIEAGQLGILKWNGTWSKEVLEIGAGSGSGSGSGVSLGTLLAQLNNENPFPTDNGQVLTYNGNNFVWKTPTSGSGVTLSPVMNAMNNQLGKTTFNTPQFLYWNGSTYTWKNESEISGGSGSIQVAQTPEYSGESESWVSATKLRFIGITGAKPTITTNSNKGCVDVGIPTGGGSGSSSRIKYITLFNSRGSSFETIDLGTADTIGFMAGNNVSLEALVKEYTNVIKISATGGSGGSGSSGTTSGRLRFYKDSSEESWNGESDFKIIFGSGLNVTWDSHSQITLSATGGSGGSTSTSVSWEDVTNKPSTFTPSSHTHSASDITNFESTVKGIKVDDASHADAANKLASSVYLWGNSFNGVRNIGSATSNKADLRYVNNIYTGDTFGLYNTVNGIDTSLLSIDNTPNISVAYGYRSNENAILSLFGNKTKIYTNGQNYHFDFVRNVFDVNSNQIHFGSETNGGKIYWDAANNAFKIEGNVYATGGITALGVSNNATTSNNVDFTFRSVTIPGNRQNKVQLTDDGLVFYSQNIINAYYKKDSIGLYDSANDASSTIFRFTDGKLTFDPNVDSFTIKFNQAIECTTDEDTLYVGIEGSSHGNILFSTGSRLRFNYNNKNYNFNVAKAIEQGILTI